MKLKQMLKSKGGWIGMIILPIILSNVRIGPMGQSEGLINNLLRYKQYPFALLLFVIVGFIIGYFIETKLLKRK